jgi:hypothetical protein
VSVRGHPTGPASTGRRAGGAATSGGRAWNATQTQSGSTVTARNETYNGPIAAGAAVSFGFLAGWTTSNAKPTGFTLNGMACATG